MPLTERGHQRIEDSLPAGMRLETPFTSAEGQYEILRSTVRQLTVALDLSSEDGHKAVRQFNHFAREELNGPQISELNHVLEVMVDGYMSSRKDAE